jgi:hypothetical protein
MKETLYKWHRGLRCLKCGHNGAIQAVGKLKEDGKLSPIIGFGGTIPLVCTNCGNCGLIDTEIEGYKIAFEKN